MEVHPRLSQHPPRRPVLRLFGLGVAALLLTAAPAPEALQTVAGDIYIVPENEVVGENLYVSASVVRVHGTIEGDLMVVATSRLQVTGSVRGDVVGFARTASIGGTVGGSVRLAGVDLGVSGKVGDEVAVLARDAVLGGEIGADALVWAIRLLAEGGLGRDLGGRTLYATIDGRVGRDVEMTVDHLRVGPGAVIVGDLGYRSADDAEIDPGASIGGTLVRRTPLSPDIWLRAGRLLGGLVIFLLFMAMGLLAIRFRPGWLYACVERVRRRPAGIVVRGVVALLILSLPVTVPVLAIWAGPPRVVMAAVIAGLVVLVPAFLAFLLAFIAGSVPVIVWAWGLVTRFRMGPYGSFVAAALVLVILLQVPYVGGVLATVLPVLALGVAFRNLPQRWRRV